MLYKLHWVLLQTSLLGCIPTKTYHISVSNLRWFRSNAPAGGEVIWQRLAHESLTECILLNSQQLARFCVTFTSKQYVCQNAYLRKQTCVIYTNKHMYVIVYDHASACNYMVRAVFASQLRLLKHAVIHNGSVDSDQSEAIAHECSSQVLRYSLFVLLRDIHTIEYLTCDTRTSTTASNAQHRGLIRTQHVFIATFGRVFLSFYSGGSSLEGLSFLVCLSDVR